METLMTESKSGGTTRQRDTRLAFLRVYFSARFPEAWNIGETDRRTEDRVLLWCQVESM